MDTKEGKGWGWWWCDELGDWIDIYTLVCIKWITNKNLLYKKINKIKFKNSTTTKAIVIKQCGTGIKTDTQTNGT